MKERLMRFMYGRYGVDSFAKFLLGLSLSLFVLSSLMKNQMLYSLALVIVVYDYFRIFSKNHYKRASENQKYLNYTAKLRTRFANFKYRFQQSKTHHIYKCPTCKQKIRIPRGKGKIEIRCPKCNTTFIKRS